MDDFLPAALLIAGALIILVVAGLMIARRVRRAKLSKLKESGAPTLSFGPRPIASRRDSRS
jgi:hypothetical protein